MARTPQLGFKNKPIIGVVHLPPLPGSPGFRGDFDRVIERAVEDASILGEEGVDAIIIENYGDKPFPIRVQRPETIAAITIIVREVAKTLNYRLPIGVSLLRNSGPEALAVAYAAGASFIRVNAYCEPRISPEGLLEPVMREVEEKRSTLNAYHVKVLADIDCKHSTPLTPAYNPADAALECTERGRPDALIVTGRRTGTPPPPGYVAAIAKATPLPVLLGSGITRDNIQAYWSLASGFIVGTYFKKQGVTVNPVDRKRVRMLLELVGKLREKLNA